MLDLPPNESGTSKIDKYLWIAEGEAVLVQVSHCAPQCTEYRQLIYDKEGKLESKIDLGLDLRFGDPAVSPDGFIVAYRRFFFEESSLRYGLGVVNVSSLEIEELDLPLPEWAAVGNLFWFP